MATILKFRNVLHTEYPDLVPKGTTFEPLEEEWINLDSIEYITIRGGTGKVYGRSYEYGFQLEELSEEFKKALGLPSGKK